MGYSRALGKTPFEMDIGNYRGYYKMRGGPSQDIVSRARVFLGGHDDVKLDVTSLIMILLLLLNILESPGY